MAAADILHRSSYSTVFLGSPGDGVPLSCYKVYEKAVLQARHWLNISRECCILSRLQEARVQGVVQLISVADTPQHFSLQFRPCFGGNLYQAIGRREFDQESQLCSKVIIPLLRVLEQLHALGIIHRDIKPENVFFESDGCLVLGDFGLAVNSSTDKPCSRVGTHDYMAPEVMAQPSADLMASRKIPRSLLRPYSSAVDVWALGVMVHEALTGTAPFCHPDPAVVALKVQFAAPCKLPGHASAECQAFVDAVLDKQPGKRPSAAALLQHAWVQKHIAHAAPMPKSFRYSCPTQRRASNKLPLVTHPSNDSCSSYSSKSSNSFSSTTIMVDAEGCADATAAPARDQVATHTPAATAAAGFPSHCAVACTPAAPAGKLASDRAKASTCATVCGVTSCKQLQPQTQKPADAAAIAPCRDVLEQRAATLPSNSSACRIGATSGSSSAEHDPVVKLVLVPALSAPTMLLEPHIAAALPSRCTPQAGSCGPAVVAGSGSSPASWIVQAAAACAGPESSGVQAAAEGPGQLRGSSWSPGVPGSSLAAAAGTADAAVVHASSCSKPAAAGKQQESVAVAGAMGAHRVPAAAACAAAAAAAAGATAAAAAAATPSVKSLLSPVGSPLSQRCLRSTPVPAVTSRCHSASQLVLGSEGCAAAAAATSCLDHTATPPPAARISQGGRVLLPHAVPCVLLAGAACEAASGQAVLPLQSPTTACRVMTAVRTKMLHVLGHTQPGQAC